MQGVLEEDETIKAKMPFMSLLHHRMVFMAANNKEFSPNKVVITPFLHERKIFLTRMDPNY